MRKVLFSVIALLISVGIVNAQEAEESEVLKSKKGTPILPQSGDYALGIDAAPMINFAGQIIQSIGMNAAGAAAASPGFNQLTEPISGLQSIYFKKFTSDDEAWRVKAIINLTSNTFKSYERGDEEWDGLSDKTDYAPLDMDVTDKSKQSVHNFGVLVGKEMRRGYGRLQGFYGIETGLMYNSTNNSYKYGNEYLDNTDAGAALDGNPTFNDFGANDLGGGARLLKQTNRSFTFMLNGFVGVEYFVLPKMAIGGEMYLGLAYTGQGKNKTESEAWDATENEVVVTETKGYINPNSFTLQNATGGKGVSWLRVSVISCKIACLSSTKRNVTVGSSTEVSKVNSPKAATPEVP